LYRLFLTPDELTSLLEQQSLKPIQLVGMKPRIFSAAFFRLLWTGHVPEELKFEFTPSLRLAYVGCAQKRA
jgi:hypothetical protein